MSGMPEEEEGNSPREEGAMLPRKKLLGNSIFIVITCKGDGV